MPIIHIIGLPGAGKSTLGKRLVNKFRIPIYGIGRYRSKFPESLIGEADVWLALFCDLSRRQWMNCILETTGLNCREVFLEKALPPYQRITVKLEAKRKILYERIGKKKRREQGYDWLFSHTYGNKYEFVKKLFKEFKDMPADIKIDTSKLKPRDVYKIVLEKLEGNLLKCAIEVLKGRSKDTEL